MASFLGLACTKNNLGHHWRVRLRRCAVSRVRSTAPPLFLRLNQSLPLRPSYTLYRLLFAEPCLNNSPPGSCCAVPCCTSRAITSPAYAQWSALRRVSPPAQRDYLVSQAVVLSLRDAVLALLLLFLCGGSSAYMQLAFPSAEVWKQSISIDMRHCRTFCGPD